MRIAQFDYGPYIIFKKSHKITSILRLHIRDQYIYYLKRYIIQ